MSSQEKDYKPEVELIITDLLQRAYNEAIKGNDNSDLIGAVIILRESDHE